jgi:hypothetical protein
MKALIIIGIGFSMFILKNDMIGLYQFDSSVPGAPKIKGEIIVTSILGVELDHSKWRHLGAVVAILIYI